MFRDVSPAVGINMTKEEDAPVANSSLTTHVLDTTRGIPAAGMKIELWSLDQSKILKTVKTNSDGRLDEPLLTGEKITPGTYELLFFVGDYFGERRFLDRVPVRFVISDAAAKYHVPLLVSPWAYSTYRGS
jgi:hydroxyisourate hydrolase